MAGYKETPRQKMIAMMYLVLTALLALNVSKEILNAFLVVNESMESTNESISSKLDDAYAKIKMQYDLNREKVEPFYDKAQEIKSKSQELVEYLEALKLKLVEVSERKPVEEVKELYYKDTLINGKNKEYLMLEKVPTEKAKQ